VLNNTLNRVTARLARTGHGPFSLVRHVGGKSGRTYDTPVILARVPEGFIAELTYRERVNLYRNDVAAQLRRRLQAEEFQVDGIEPHSAERGRTAFPAPFRLVLQVAGRTEFRLLRTGDSAPPR
jgi:hypothetical protein